MISLLIPPGGQVRRMLLQIQSRLVPSNSRAE